VDEDPNLRSQRDTAYGGEHHADAAAAAGHDHASGDAASGELDLHNKAGGGYVVSFSSIAESPFIICAPFVIETIFSSKLVVLSCSILYFSSKLLVLSGYRW
jgi:hypothetical protein